MSNITNEKSALAMRSLFATAQPIFPLPDNVRALPSADRREKLRVLEALLFAAAEPTDETALAEHFKPGEDLGLLLTELQLNYAARGVNLVRIGGKWAFRTADDLAFLLERYAVEQRRLSKAALETLAIIAYHQPVTRADIEDIRGVSTSKGTLDVLLPRLGTTRMRSNPVRRMASRSTTAARPAHLQCWMASRTCRATPARTISPT
jgi:segregation and condensation protein B